MRLALSDSHATLMAELNRNQQHTNVGIWQQTQKTLRLNSLAHSSFTFLGFTSAAGCDNMATFADANVVRSTYVFVPPTYSLRVPRSPLCMMRGAPAGVPLVYELDDDLKVIPHKDAIAPLQGRYLGDLAAVKARIEGVANQTK